jgi:hypothetical protein
MKAAVERVKKDFAFSERRACDVLRLPVSTFRYRSIGAMSHYAGNSWS